MHSLDPSIQNIVSFVRKNNRKLIALICSVYGLYLRSQIYAQRTLSPDELNQLNYTQSGPLLPFWNLYTSAELTAFPGDYLLTLPFIKVLGADKWAIAIPHILATLFGFYFLYLICQKHLKTVLGFMIAFALVCLNSNLIYHSFEFRPYAVLPTLALMTFYFSEMVVCQDSQLNRFKKMLIGIFFILTVMYHAYGILMVFLCMAFFILTETDNCSITKIFKRIYRFSIILAGLTIPLFLWYASRNPVAFESPMGSNFNTFDYISNPLVNINAFGRSVMGNLIGFKKLKWLVNGILLSIFIPQKERWHQLRFLLILIIAPILLILLADLNSGYWFLKRQFVWVMPLFAFLIGWCWDSVLACLLKVQFVQNFLHKKNFRP